LKRLIFINGTMGVGKTTVARALQKKLPSCAFLDGDWCWDASPFVVTDETKEMVLGNIAAVLDGLLRCSAYENIILAWVMHEKTIIDDILGRLSAQGCDFFLFTLIACPEVIKQRLCADIESGLRSKGIITRSQERAEHYQDMNSVVIDTGDLTPEQAAGAIISALDEDMNGACASDS